MDTYVRDIRKGLENLGLVRSDSSWFGGFIVGAGLGVIAGAAAAALLTPSDGKEMRKLVSKKAKQLAVTAERMSERPRRNGARVHHA